MQPIFFYVFQLYPPKEISKKYGHICLIKTNIPPLECMHDFHLTTLIFIFLNEGSSIEDNNLPLYIGPLRYVHGKLASVKPIIDLLIAFLEANAFEEKNIADLDLFTN